MEKTHQITSPKGVCTKLHRAISANCAPRRSHHRLKHGSELQTAISPVIEQAAPPATVRKSTNVPIESGPKPSFKIEVAKPFENYPKDEKKPMYADKNAEASDAYSDYINRVRNTMGMPAKSSGETNVGKPANRLGSTRRDSFNDKILNLINRGKKKIRAQS